VIDIPSLAPGLRQTEPGVWKSDTDEAVAFTRAAHARCFAVEDTSFWFRHRSAALLEVIDRYPPSGVIFDVGGGNGCVTRALLDAGYEAVLVEPGAEGVRNARRRGIPHIIHATMDAAGFRAGVLPAIGLFDVLEHVEDDAALLRALRDVLQPGGLIYLAVPAHTWLWSDADVDAGHFRRYSLTDLRSRLTREGFEIDYATYLFSYLVVPVGLLRSLPSRLVGPSGRRNRHTRTKAEHGSGNGVLRPLLERLLAFECSAIRAGRALPTGTSCLVVARAPRT